MSANTVKTTWVAVADGEKGLLFRNDDTDQQPLLTVLRKEEIENPSQGEQAANRRGRMQDNGAGGVQRSAVEDTDWHELGKERFAKDFAEILNKAVLKNAFDRLMLFAPPQAMGRLRDELRDDVRDKLVLEETSDLTNHPVEEIEQKIAEHFKTEPDFEADLRRTS